MVQPSRDALGLPEWHEDRDLNHAYAYPDEEYRALPAAEFDALVARAALAPAPATTYTEDRPATVPLVPLCAHGRPGGAFCPHCTRPAPAPTTERERCFSCDSDERDVYRLCKSGIGCSPDAHNPWHDAPAGGEGKP
jgi:hypothetical protein